jgi:hypothetical protein
MINDETAANGGAGMDLDARQQTPDVGDEPAEQPKAALPYGMGHPVKLNGMQSRIAQHYFEARPRRGIAGHKRLDVLF